MNKFAYEAGAQQALVDSGLLSKEAMEVPAWLASAITGTGNVAKKTWGATRDFAQRGGRLAKDLYAKHPYEIAGGGGALAGAGVGALAGGDHPGLGALAGAGIGGGLGLGGMRLLKLLQAGAARRAGERSVQSMSELGGSGLGAGGAAEEMVAGNPTLQELAALMHGGA